MLHLELEMILHVSDKYINYAWQTLYLSNVNWKKIAMQAVLDSITIQELGTLMSETTFSLIVNDGFTVVELGLAQQEQTRFDNLCSIPWNQRNNNNNRTAGQPRCTLMQGKVFLLGF